MNAAAEPANRGGRHVGAGRIVAYRLGAGLVLATLGAGGPVWSGVVRVTLNVPTRELIDMEGIRKVLVTRFIIDDDVPQFDMNRELISALRRGLRRGTSLEILDVEPPSLPEQPIADLLANTGFWRRLASRHDADLVIAGKAGFVVADRSGFIQVDEISPVTGQRVRRTRFIDREAFTLLLNLFFVRGSTGALLYEDHFAADETYTGLGNDELSGVHELFGRLEDDILGIVVPRSRTVQRNLFTD